MTEDIAEKIRHRAFQIWQEQGQPHGRDQDHWLQAEAEVIAPAVAAPVAAAPVAAAPAAAKPAPQKKAPAKKAAAPKADAAKPKKTPAAKA